MMAEPTKESALEEVAAAPIVVDPSSALEKEGRREGEDALEKESVNAEKLRVDEKKTEYQDAPPTKNAHLDSISTVGSYGLEDDTYKEIPAIEAKNGNVASENKNETSCDEDVAGLRKASPTPNDAPVTAVDNEDKCGGNLKDETHLTNVVKAPPAKNAHLDSDNVVGSYGLEDDNCRETPAIEAKNGNVASENKDQTSCDEDVAGLKKASPTPTNDAPVTAVENEEESGGNLEDETNDNAEPQKKKIKTLDSDVEMTDVAKIEGTAENGGSLVEQNPEPPSIPKEQTVESKTVFIGNLSFSIEQDDVEDFLQPAGEIVGIRFAMHPNETFRGFGYVEFASAEAAEKAVRELNGKELLRRPVRVDFVREKGSHTPYGSGKDTNSPKRGQTVFIRGFDKEDGGDRIRRSLEQHFRSCGDITRVTVLKDYDGGVKGIAYIDFKDNDAFNRALELNGSELGGNPLLVEPAKPRFSSHDNAGGGRRGGWGYGSRFGGGGRSFGGRFGGGSGSRSFGGGFSSGRGRGWW